MAAGLDGFAQLGAALKDLKDPKQIGRTLGKGVRAAMTPVLKRAQQLAPVGTVEHKVGKRSVGTGTRRTVQPGFGKRSIRLRVKIDRTGHKATAVIGVERDAWYMVALVELGTSKMAAQPWLRPAFKASTNPMVQAMAGELNEWVLSIARAHRGAGNINRANQLEAELDH